MRLKLPEVEYSSMCTSDECVCVVLISIHIYIYVCISADMKMSKPYRQKNLLFLNQTFRNMEQSETSISVIHIRIIIVYNMYILRPTDFYSHFIVL